MSKRLCKICKIKPPYLNFQWLIGPSLIYVAKQQRTKWNHQKNIFLTFQWLCMLLSLYKQFLRLGQNLPLSFSLLWHSDRSPFLMSAIFKMAAKTRYQKWAVKIQHCPISSKFDMWVDNDIPNWLPTSKNFYQSPFSKWPPQYRKNSTLFDFKGSFWFIF